MYNNLQDTNTFSTWNVSSKNTNMRIEIHLQISLSVIAVLLSVGALSISAYSSIEMLFYYQHEQLDILGKYKIDNG